VPPIAQQISAPTTRSELKSLIARRDELQTQLQSLMDRRPQLASEVAAHYANSPVTEAPRQMLKALDADIKRVDASLRTANEYIEAAKATGLGSEEVGSSFKIFTDVGVPTPPPPIVFSEPPWQVRLGNLASTTLPITLAGVVLVGALLYWRISRSMKNQLTRIMSMQSGRLEELQRSIDTVAVEVERVSENQRFVTKLAAHEPAIPQTHEPTKR
jgi:hypothetical protein